MDIVPAVATDLDAIVEIERYGSRTAWTAASLAAELARAHAFVDVARGPGVVGYNNYWVIPASGELHILAIATHPDHRRQGIAGALLDHALTAARGQGATLATLEVRRGNHAAIALYTRVGFRTVHVRARYYQDDGEDALVMLADFPSVARS